MQPHAIPATRNQTHSRDRMVWAKALRPQRTPARQPLALDLVHGLAELLLLLQLGLENVQLVLRKRAWQSGAFNCMAHI